MKNIIIDFGKSIVLDGLRLGTAAIVSDVIRRGYKRYTDRNSEEEEEPESSKDTPRISKSFLEGTTDES